MELNSVLRILITAIALLIGIVLLSLFLRVAGALLVIAVKALVVLLVVAIALRFFGLLKERR